MSSHFRFGTQKLDAVRRAANIAAQPIRLQPPAPDDNQEGRSAK